MGLNNFLPAKYVHSTTFATPLNKLLKIPTIRRVEWIEEVLILREEK